MAHATVICPCCSASVEIDVDVESVDVTVMRTRGGDPPPGGANAHPSEGWTRKALAEIAPAVTGAPK